MSDLFVVHKLSGGYAREDSPNTSVVGVYTSEPLARQVALVSGFCIVTRAELNYVPLGIKEAITAYGLSLVEV